MKKVKNCLLGKFIIMFPLCLWMFSCTPKNEVKEKESIGHKKIGVLLVNHGSPSKTWRDALLSLEKDVKDEILSDGKVQGIKTAFMEYVGPSIADQLKKFDAEGFTDVVIVPVFLTVSPHTFEDIPTIIGSKETPESKEMLKLEQIERYTPKAKTYITPLLDFTDILQKNVVKRCKELSKDPSNEGFVLVGYGDETYDKEWKLLFEKVATKVKSEIGINQYSYAWCGHIAHYSSEPTTKAIENVLKSKSKALVIPVLVAHDENFQIKIIGGGIEKVKDSKNKVIYKPDALLPDANISEWVIKVSKEYVNKIQ